MFSRNPERVSCHTVAEFAWSSARAYANPFGDVLVDVVFTDPAGLPHTLPAFYAGQGCWKARFNPAQPGLWRWELRVTPADPELAASGAFEALPHLARGRLRAMPGQGWGLIYASGEPAFILGDTTYNLFGMAHCGYDVESFIARRARQGFNLLRVRVPVSPYHPPEGYSAWQTRRTWPWGGSEQKPALDRFNLDYFATVDRVVRQAEAHGVGLEMIMEAWGFEYPFNRRDVFLPEWEELWMRYLIARYDAYNCVYFWTLMNEYEYYPDGDWRHNPVADRWALRMARWVKATAPHGHIVAVHNGPRLPTFASRFQLDPSAVDAVMFQDWGTRDAERGWLAAGIEEVIQAALEGWGGAAVFAEWGYERNEGFPLHVPGHKYCDDEHTRRGAWRGAFCALGIIHGFENTWGPFCDLEHDQEGMVYLLHARRFFTEVCPFAELRPAPEVLVSVGQMEPGTAPLALADAGRDRLAIYLPVGGCIALAPELAGRAFRARWFDPVTGALSEAVAQAGAYVAPERIRKGHPQDWVLVLDRT
jgi:hypothetical protein